MPASTAPATSPVPVRDTAFDWKRSALVLAAGLLVVGICLLQGRPTAASDAGVQMDLPYRLGSYWGTPQEPSPAEKTVLPPDTEIVRKVYDAFGGEQVVCSIVLSGKERRSIHRPEVCLPGQGWTVRETHIVPVSMKSGRTMRVKELLLEREVLVGPGQKRKINSLFYYWFVGKQITTPDHYFRVFYSSWDLIAHNINHRWAYVIVTSVVTSTTQRDGKSIPQTREMLTDFIREITPTFQYSEMPEKNVPAPAAR